MSETDARLEAALRDCAALLEAGTLPAAGELRRRYGDIADELLGCLEALAGVRAGVALSSPDPGPTALGDFRLIREVGRGGMGVVYEAEQVSLGRRVALKVLPFVAALDPRQIQRFKHEAQAAALLHHPHIVPVFGVGSERGVHYYAMQLIDGRPLSALIDERRGAAAAADAPTGRRADTSRPPREWWAQAARLAADAADGLEHAHAQGVVHRDIKPANLLLDGDGKLWVTDFGLARLSHDGGLTRTGDLVGTARYMSPEQALGRAGLDHRTDVYSLGVTLYELLTLRPAFPDPEREALLRRIPLDEPAAPRSLVPDLPLDLETVVLKAVAKEPDARYESAAALAADLRRWLADEAVQARRPTIGQRLGRWGRRHRGLVRASAAFLGLALVGLCAAVGLLWRAWDGEARARAAAERNADLGWEA
ncbi:MAG: serine/threonine-protein kinase, partial [Gemmataceae bacterium]